MEPGTNCGGLVTGVALALVAAVFGCQAGAEGPELTQDQAHSPRVVEIRSYNLEPGTRAEFHRLVVEEGLPLLREWNVDVVAYGPSPHNENSYFLIRAFPSLEEPQRIEDGFYGSAKWREGPREAVLALIESYATTVLDLDPATVEALREAGRGAAITSP
ncbi:MAG: NIPSNAP family protein [Gemmatimonadota bacterium]